MIDFDISAVWPYLRWGISMFNPKFLLIFFFSEISKNEDTLKEYMLYKQFLDSLTPQVVCR